MRRLIEFGKPPVVFGEQVASKAGREWLAGVRDDMEALGYDFGAADLCAASIGCPQVRKRLFWVASVSGSAGGKRLEPRENLSISRPWRWGGEESVQEIASSPFQRTDLWPAPIVRKMDDGIPNRMALLRGYGNAIVPQLAAEFVSAFMECIGVDGCW